MYHAAGGQTLLTPLAPLEDWKEFFVGLGEMMFQACQGFYKWFYRKKNLLLGIPCAGFVFFVSLKKQLKMQFYMFCVKKRDSVKRR